MPTDVQSCGPQIAIAGATGRVGAALVGKLLDDPVQLVALSRRAKNDVLPINVPMRTIEFDRHSSLVDALRGVERLFLAHGTSAQQVKNELALIDAAIESGVSYIVKLSAMGPPSKYHPFDWHTEIEARLADTDLGYTILRPSTFTDVLSRAGAFVLQDLWGGAAGDGRVNFINTSDVADVARVALMEERPLTSRRAYHLTGPKAVSMPEIAEAISRLLGRKVAYEHRAPDVQKQTLLDAGLTEMAAEISVGLDRIFHDSAMSETTNTYYDITGKEPKSVDDWLKRNIAHFTSPRTN